jgi:hypothetical protein
LKISGIPNREPFIGPDGILAPNADRWLRAVSESQLKVFADAGTPPVAPNLPKGELCVFKATGISKTYLVWYDGVNRFYWETTGTDLY